MLATPIESASQPSLSLARKNKRSDICRGLAHWMSISIKKEFDSILYDVYESNMSYRDISRKVFTVSRWIRLRSFDLWVKGFSSNMPQRTGCTIIRLCKSVDPLGPANLWQQ